MKKSSINPLTSTVLTLSLAGIICIHLGLNNAADKRIKEIPEQISSEKKYELNQILDEKFPSRKNICAPLPYKTVPKEMEIAAESAILIDALTGSILFEKNADTIIPPASMTKLVEMYVVFEAVENKEVSLDDIVPLPKESWGINLPSDASLMFLAQGQKVTLRELLLGLSIASGNDASIAVANYVCGSMNEFVERMNEVCRKAGLKETHFVESSGYSEKNLTTAREFVSFCKKYIDRFPFALEEFHAQKKIEYPKEHNLPEYLKGKEGNHPIVQYNTNKLLGNLEGVDGLKTGFIYESGYNLSLTAKRGKERFISVTMKGPGIGSKEGNVYRVKDGTNLMEYAFSTFADYDEKIILPQLILAGSEKKSIRLVNATQTKLTVPAIGGIDAHKIAKEINIEISIPKILYGKIEAGDKIGEMKFLWNDFNLMTVPLAAEISSEEKKSLIEAIIFHYIKYIRK